MPLVLTGCAPSSHRLDGPLQRNLAFDANGVSGNLSLHQASRTDEVSVAITLHGEPRGSFPPCFKVVLQIRCGKAEPEELGWLPSREPVGWAHPPLYCPSTGAEYKLKGRIGSNCGGSSSSDLSYFLQLSPCLARADYRLLLKPVQLSDFCDLCPDEASLSDSNLMLTSWVDLL